jgi:hypothetical protein
MNESLFASHDNLLEISKTTAKKADRSLAAPILMGCGDSNRTRRESTSAHLVGTVPGRSTVCVVFPSFFIPLLEGRKGVMPLIVQQGERSSARTFEEGVQSLAVRTRNKHIAHI